MSRNGSASRAVAITGVGIITSLGEGKDENWRRLSAGESGIHRLRRFPAEGLRTTICGSVDFLPVAPISAPTLTLELARTAAREAIAQSGIGEPGRFPGDLFLAAPPLEQEWPQRRRLALRAGWRTPGTCSYEDLLKAAGQDDA